MNTLLTRNLVQNVGTGLQEWMVFIYSLACSLVGVAASFFVFLPKLTELNQPQLWVLGLMIAIVMLGLTYGAKFAAGPEARTSFTPVDLLLYISQGFLWPSTWPALADWLHFITITPPNNAGLLFLLDVAHRLSTTIIM